MHLTEENLMNIEITPCLLSDITQLSEIARETYSETFSDINSPETMSSYIEGAFNTEQLRKEISNPDSLFLFLICEGNTAGYLKLNEHIAQTEFQEPDGLEIERIYLRKDFQGVGLGSTLLDKAIDIAKIKNKSYVWLGVWEQNEQAIAFYEHKGFKKTGYHYFEMGSERQKDYIMRKNLENSTHYP